MAAKPDATFSEIMNRLAFIGDSDPLEDDNAEEGSLYQAGEAQKGDPQKGGTQYYASPMPGTTKRTNETAGYSGKWTEGVDENQFMSILQSLNDSVKGLAGES
ncbi:MAG: hypothetical protein GY702_24350, partial [Desulfobulbaceae bacterium]|nr:hypothetical protein [Desulfobulbaceae bacterium]